MRQPITFFVSYAHEDARDAGALLQHLRPQLRPSKRYDYTLWRDTDILVGEKWHDTIMHALTTCYLGLCLVSPGFFASSYIAKHELPRFLGAGAAPVIPVMLSKVDWQRHDLRGLEAHQIFQMVPGQAFADCRDARSKRRFAEALFGQIECRLDRLFPMPPTV